LFWLSWSSLALMHLWHLSHPLFSATFVYFTWYCLHRFYWSVFQFLGHRQAPNGLELRCVHTSTKSFSNFDLIWSVGRPQPDMCTSVTLTQSKVKVMELLKFWKLHFSRSISSAIFAWSSKLTVDGDSMAPGLQLVRAWFSNFYRQHCAKRKSAGI